MAEYLQHTAEEQIIPLTAPVLDLPAERLPEQPLVANDVLRASALALADAWRPVEAKLAKGSLDLRLKQLKSRLRERLHAAKAVAKKGPLTPPLELLESTRALEGVLLSMVSADKDLQRLPHVELPNGEVVPRVMNLGEAYLEAARGIWSAESLTMYVGAVQQHDTLLLGEVRMLPTALRLAQLEFVLDRADETFASGAMPPIEESPFSAPLHSLRRLNQFEWQEVLEPLVPFHAILAEDPAGAFLSMEEENRESYRDRVAELAKHADASEVETARAALTLAQGAAARGEKDARLQRRRAHIGFFLFEEGLPALEQRIGYHPPYLERFRRLLLSNNEDVYILGIFVMSLLLIVVLIAPLVPRHTFGYVIATLFLALLPATQGAADLVNNVVTSWLRPRALPKIDLSDGIPAELTTLVVVPTLLLSHDQVRETFEDLEARYLSNEDPHLHFALLTDLPDSLERPRPEDHDPLVELAMRITDELNAKYANGRGGRFLLLHRLRLFNARQGVWMGWERKRGKLLDLNNLILGEFDSFPLKAGPVEVLKDVHYVITLDADTQLPRGAAARMIGTMAHPLNQAIVDPKLRIVTRGYGILQPRVGVSVSSASRSRLASLYSGETGFDIYTRAVSDVYQDLFGEGIFTGKGIYDVAALHQTLHRRFPRNALLSHDLIEGAYARAGLVTDIEVIDDYPSHHSAHTRRKHRWVRGDWQIVQWLSNRVPDESGRMVANPISTISRWKILDNLRRSLVEAVTFLLLIAGWFFLPGGPLYWTLVTLVLLLLPSLVQLGFSLGRALAGANLSTATEGLATFSSSVGFALISLAFLPHQALLAVDAIGRTLTRRFVTGKKLLEWETAAQSEQGKRKPNPLDRYLQITPLLALAIAGLLYVTHHVYGLLVATPILLLWALSPALAGWLNASPRRELGPLSAADRRFLEHQALLIWRYFAQFGGEANHWLIPDNVEERNTFQVRKLSPTNLGMLFNARQAALELGYLTLPEFAHATRSTLRTYDRLEKQRGHIYNWYDIETLQPIAPRIVSAVDSGNLLASLHSLYGGAMELLKQPLLHYASFHALHQMLELARQGPIAEVPLPFAPGDIKGLRAAVRWLLEVQPVAPGEGEAAPGLHRWYQEEAERRRLALREFVEGYAPWLLPRFEQFLGSPEFDDPVHREQPALQYAQGYVALLQSRLHPLLASSSPSALEHGLGLARELNDALSLAGANLQKLREDVQAIASSAEQHGDAMEYGFLLVEARQLLSIGFDGATGELYSACYDLLASEARIAYFLAVAKGDIPQQSWFRLDRSHVLVNGRAALLSWTGTMFEYLMPTLWMRCYADTLIARTLESAAVIQREHVRRIPWGISESGMGRMDANGRYGYQAFGIPALALKYGAEDGPVISPYSTFLTLNFGRKEAIANLRRMESMGWMGGYGLYEAADYMEGADPVLVRSWMAHHQGMSLLAVTNLLAHNVFQRWFHAHPRVRAAELLLHERPLAKATLKALAKQAAPVNVEEKAA